MLNRRIDERVVVYTVITGSYDRLRATKGDAQWICFTDGTASAAAPWSRRLIPSCPTIDARIRQAREIKLRPHLFLPAHDVSIWVDANLQLIVEPCVLVDYVSRADVATFSYPDTYGFRDCAYQEARACIERSKDDAGLIEAQMNRYRQVGFPEHAGLAETSIVVRRNSPNCRRFCEIWWREVKRGSRRDQLSFDFACWRAKSGYAVLPGSRVKSPFAAFWSHEVDIYGSNPRLHT